MFEAKKLLETLVTHGPAGAGTGATPAEAHAGPTETPAAVLGAQAPAPASTPAAAPAAKPAAGSAFGVGTIISDVIGVMTKGELPTPAREAKADPAPQPKAEAAPKPAPAAPPPGDMTDYMLVKAQEFLRSPQGNMAVSAVLGGLAGMVMSSKSGRKLAEKAGKIGGVAMIGGLAAKAYGAWQSGGAAAPADVKEAKAITEAPRALPAPGPSAVPGVDKASPETALLMLRAMIAAAAADGHIDAIERERILGGLRQAGLEGDAARFIEAEFARPAPIGALAASAKTPEVAMQVYAAARLAIDPDKTEERVFLAQLAGALALDPRLVAQIDAAAAGAKAG